MGIHSNLLTEIFPMSRPKILANCAKYGARRYQRARDLPGAVSGLLSKSESEILPTLISAEAQCEEQRRAGSAAYRPGQHVQVLSALLAESAALAQVKASGSAAFRSAMNAFRASSISGSSAGA